VNASDRVALMLGRALLRAEALQDELDAAKQRIAELEAQEEPATSVSSTTMKP
jgi:hypothetical protein